MSLGGFGPGDLMKMVSQIGNIKENMGKFQEKMKDTTADGEAGGGMVKVTVNGSFEIVNVTIDPEVLSDPETAAPLFAAATNTALKKIREKLQEEAKTAFGGLDLPPGMLGA